MPTVSKASELKVDSISYEYAALSWGGEVGVYQVLISADGSLVKDTVVSAHKLGVFLKPGTAYTWQVANVNAGVKSNFIAGPGFATTAVQDPADLQVSDITIESAMLSWIGYDDEYYHIVVSSGTAVIDTLVLGASLEAEGLLPTTTYSWNVTLILPAYTSASVAGEEFTTLTPPDLSIADVTGTYDVAINSYWYGTDYSPEEGIVIEETSNSDILLIKNLLDAGTAIEAVFDPEAGTLTADDEQLLLEGFDLGEEGSPELYDIYFVNADAAAPVVFNIPEAGKITSPVQMWGYYLVPVVEGEGEEGFYDVYTESTWTRTSTDTSPSGVKALVKKNVTKHSWKQTRKFSK
ncbi:hypothetical protein FACS189413_13730 [Bacteroidia bacterium]|nr:hypothetical protein FACS189413_13730 [Bacteroidia bacterium]